ncbi:hypothetical protein GQ457_07G002400 [Hibiscus cannabinus]
MCYGNRDGNLALLIWIMGINLFVFADEVDLHNVLTGGPWVIYDSYLTVQSWSRFFSMKDDHPFYIVAWVLLQNLPYRYYTKSLFRHIVAAIERVVRVDYNTAEGKRGRFARLVIVVDLEKPLVSGIIIDGHKQDIEYEGLPTICFKCGKYGHAKEICGITPIAEANDVEDIAQRNPDDLYGPWMQVPNHRRRNVQPKEDLGNDSDDKLKCVGSGSRFLAIANIRIDMVRDPGISMILCWILAFWTWALRDRGLPGNKVPCLNG